MCTVFYYLLKLDSFSQDCNIYYSILKFYKDVYNYLNCDTKRIKLKKILKYSENNNQHAYNKVIH